MLTESAYNSSEVRAEQPITRFQRCLLGNFSLRSESLLLVAPVRDKFEQNLLFKALAFPFAIPSSV